MKLSVKISSSNNKIKNRNSLKKKVSNGIVSHKKNSKKEVFIVNNKISSLSKVRYSMKRHGKRFIKNALLSHSFNVFSKVIMGIILFFAVSYGLYGYFGKAFSNDIIVSKSEIIDRVAKLTTLPPGKPDAIVRVEDAEILKKQNVFYENVKSGDYILMYPKLAIIYDLRNNSIIAVKKSE